jgi:hypothetical protein
MATPKKPKATTKASLSSTDSKLPKAEQANINSLFSKALSRYRNELLADQKDKHKELNHLAIIAEEYLSCFALIGYSLQDEKVVIFNTPTSKDEAALVDLLRATFIDIINNRP